MSKEKIKVKVFRFDPVKDQEPSFQTYEVPRWTHDETQAKVTIMREVRAQTVLDVLEYVFQNLDSTLSYYATCRRGHCRACGMVVNGKTVLSCLVHAKDGMKIEPLHNLPVVKDLIVKEFSDKDLFTLTRAKTLNLPEKSYKQTKADR